MRRHARSLSCLIAAAALGFACSAILVAGNVSLAQDDQAQEGRVEEEQVEEKPATEEQAEETSSPEADEQFAKSFRGKIYQGELEIEGWDDLGGGLVLPPIYVRQYQRGDGTFLVLTSREVAAATSNSPASYVVADALIVSPPQEGAEFTIACVQGEDETLRFMGEASGKDDKEWWTDIRRAWEISLDTGEIIEAKTRGIRCTNISWGQ